MSGSMHRCRACVTLNAVPGAEQWLVEERASPLVNSVGNDGPEMLGESLP